jgi:methionyl-tRNA formyltransferase
MKLILFTCGISGAKTLEVLVKNYNIGYVYTTKDSLDVIDIVEKSGIPYSTKKPDILDIKENSFDLGLSINYRFILKKEIFDYPLKGTFNIHGSLLPNYRGRCPNVWYIINGEKQYGITIHKMDSGLDTGDIALSLSRDISPEDTGSSLLDWIISVYPPFILDFLNKFESGNIQLIKQDHQKASLFGRRDPEDGKINWNSDVCRINDFVRALTKPHYPGAFSFIDGKKIIIWRCKKNSLLLKNNIPGEILSIEGDIISVACGEGILDILDYEIHDDILLSIGGLLK